MVAGSRRLGRNVLSRIGMCFLKSLTCCFSKDYSKCLEKMLESCDNKDKLEKEGTKERSAEAGASLSYAVIILFIPKNIKTLPRFPLPATNPMVGPRIKVKKPGGSWPQACGGHRGGLTPQNLPAALGSGRSTPVPTARLLRTALQL